MQPAAKLTPTFVDQFKQYGPATLNLAAQPLPPPATKVEGQVLKVALIGTAPSSRMLAPFNDPSWTIWACSPGNMNLLPRVDAWFELHANMHWPECQSYGLPYVEWLKKQAFPIYMQNQQYVPNAITFPMINMVREFGQYFFTSSFAWMMAFAISKGAKEISLFGIDMASKDEYIIQRQGFYYFLEHALKRGITVSAPLESDIMQPPGLYGYSEVEGYGRKGLARQQELKMRVAQMQQEQAAMARNIPYLEGAVEDGEYYSTIWMGITNKTILQAAEIQELKEQIAESNAQLEKAKAVNPGFASWLDHGTPLLEENKKDEC